MLKGYNWRILWVDLNTSKTNVEALGSETAYKFIGGKGLATKILIDNTPVGLEPFSENNLLIFATGPLTASMMSNSNRFTVTTKSPLTGAIVSSACGGNFALKLKKSGFDAIVIKGKAAKPSYVEILNGNVEIKDASHLWGKGTLETQGLLPKEFGKAVIGPAGENLVRYASIISEERAAGRAGVGAVMGSKNLKVIICNGEEKTDFAYDEKFKNYRKKITKYFLAHPITGDVLPRLGTTNLVMTTSGRNIIPTFNYQRGTHPLAYKISGEALADEYLVKNGGCISCAVHCGREVKYNEKVIKGPEFETTAHFGTNIGNFDLAKIIEWNYLCDDLGLDTISTANTIAFTMELTKRKMITSGLEFGKTDNISQIVKDIAYKRGIGAHLAEGVKRFSEKFGGTDFAIHVKGLELPAYDPRGCYGQGLEYATTNRGGCHIQGGTMFLEATGPLTVDPLSVKAKPELVMMQQNLFAGISSLVMCVFAAYAVIPRIVSRIKPNSLLYKIISFIMLHSGPVLAFGLRYKPPIAVLYFEKFISLITGKKYTMKSFMDAGERIFNLERLYNIREGFSAKDDILPKRLLTEPLFSHLKSGVPLDKMLKRYYKIRGWDENGIPTLKTLKRLDLEDYIGIIKTEF